MESLLAQDWRLFCSKWQTCVPRIKRPVCPKTETLLPQIESLFATNGHLVCPKILPCGFVHSSAPPLGHGRLPFHRDHGLSMKTACVLAIICPIDLLFSMCRSLLFYRSVDWVRNLTCQNAKLLIQYANTISEIWISTRPLTAKHVLLKQWTIIHVITP